MQNPIDNTTEIMISATQYPSSELKIWAFPADKNDTTEFTFTTVSTKDVEFSAFRAVHVKGNGILLILVGLDGKSLTGVYMDSFDDKYRSFPFEITKNNEVLNKDVEFIKDLYCDFVQEPIGYNYECVFLGSEEKIFYVYGDFQIERGDPPKTEYYNKITKISTSVNVDFYFTPGSIEDAKCRLTMTLIVCTFNMPINSDKSKYRITEVVYTKSNSGYGYRGGYSQKMYSILEKEALFDSFPVQVAGYWNDCIHTINETNSSPVPPSSSSSASDSLNSLFLTENIRKNRVVETENDDLLRYQLIRKYRTPELILNYTFSMGEGKRDTLKLLKDINLKIYLNQVSGQVLTLTQSQFRNFIYPNFPEVLPSVIQVLVGGVILAGGFTFVFAILSKRMAKYRQAEKDRLIEQRAAMEQQQREAREEYFQNAVQQQQEQGSRGVSDEREEVEVQPTNVFVDEEDSHDEDEEEKMIDFEKNQR